MQVKGFEIAVREGLLHCNVKFILEGEEEIGSGQPLGDFVKTHHDLLRADVILVSDTSMVSDATPSLTTGLRGLSYWEMGGGRPIARPTFRTFRRCCCQSSQRAVQDDCRLDR